MKITIGNPADVTALQLGLPTSTVLNNYSVGAANWIFYSDEKKDDSIDFMASTPAVSTQCFPMTRRCVNGDHNGDDLSSDFTYNCTSGFRVNLTSPWPYTVGNESTPVTDLTSVLTGASLTGIAFASDAALSSAPGLVQNASVGRLGQIPAKWPEIVPSNPTHFGTGAQNYPGIDSISEPLSSDPELSIGRFRNTLWFLNCTTTVAVAKYTWVNGSLGAFDTELASPETSALFTGPFSLVGLAEEFEELIKSTMSNIAQRAMLAENMDDSATTWALAFSKNVMALGVGAFTPLQTSLEQRRTESLTVARVPVGPLYLLVGFKLIYVVAVIVLAMGVYAFTHPAEIEVVKEQLSIKGLATSYFDRPQLLQHNVIKATQEELHMRTKKQSNTKGSGSLEALSSGEEQLKPGVSRVETQPRDLDGGKPRAGPAPDANGAWRFVMLANGVWHSIEPIVKTFLWLMRPRREI